MIFVKRTFGMVALNIITVLYTQNIIIGKSKTNLLEFNLFHSYLIHIKRNYEKGNEEFNL